MTIWMGPSADLLERQSYRAPLAVKPVDGVTAVTVTDGLVATAWLRADPATSYSGSPSPFSGLIGFNRLAVPWTRTHESGPAGVRATWPPSIPAAYDVLVEDTLGRYLPTLARTTVPAPAPVVVPLSSAPQRPTPSGFATVRGEVHNQAGGSPLPWSLVRVDTGTSVIQSVTDQRGRFTLYFPYPEALPPIAGSPGLAAVVWPLTISLLCKPSLLVFSGSADNPPELGSITGQAAAQIVSGGSTSASITATLKFGSPLVLTLTAVPA